MEIAPIGDVDDLDELDFEPVTIPIVAFTVDKERVVTEIRFRNAASPGALGDLARYTNEKGEIKVTLALEFLGECVYPEDKDEWDNLMHSEELFFARDTVGQVYKTVVEMYANRPTKQRSGSRGGQGSTKPTSKAAASGRTSAKKASR